ncbi:glycosyltransferase family 2 protein [Leptospira sp. 96542]|nr:glycosyltransferase family 2 protein [Leptospira sp. 96542]
MSRLSVIIITKNEAANIEDCLRSVAFADEVIVLDSGSSDGTVEIARKLGAIVKVSDWSGFGPQKNKALALATGDWVLSLDADERISPQLQAEIQTVVKNDGTGKDAWEIPRLTQFCGQWIHHSGWTPDYVLRLFRRGSAQFSSDLLHERVVMADGGNSGRKVSVARLKSQLLHFSFPTPAHHWRKVEQYSLLWAQQRHAAGKRTSMWRAAGAAFVTFIRSYFFRLGVLDGAMGFALCVAQAQGAFAKYFTLYYLNKTAAASHSVRTPRPE